MSEIEPAFDELCLLEAALLSSEEPVAEAQLVVLFEGSKSLEAVQAMLETLQQNWTSRGVHLVKVAGGWRFQTSARVQEKIQLMNPEKPPRYSRAVMETLAIIAYRQPVTRGDIEEIRGVSVSTSVMKTLEARNWIEVVGHREVPGRPALYATTEAFLNDLNLHNLSDLPPLMDIQGDIPEIELPIPTPAVAAIALPLELTSASEPHDDLSQTA
jgi:segregation and condensation protein B